MRRAIRAQLPSGIRAQLLSAFGLAVGLALLAALVSLSATGDATRSLETVQDAQQRMLSALNELELSTQVQSDAVQAFLLSGDERHLRDRASGSQRFDEAMLVLESSVDDDESLERLEAVRRARSLFDRAAASLMALNQQGWPRSAAFLWRGEGQSAKRQLEQAISDYQTWYGQSLRQDVVEAHDRAVHAQIVAVGLVLLAAAVGLGVGLRLTRSITRRLGRLGAAAHAIAHDDFSVRTDAAGSDEVAAVSWSMNQMAEHLETSQRALEESRRQLRESLDQYRLLAENATDIIFALDRDGRYRYVNSAATRLLGYLPEEVVGRHLTDFFPEERRAEQQDGFARRMRGEELRPQAEVEVYAKDGRRVPLEVRLATELRDGEIVGAQGIARDITRRKQLEAEVQRLLEAEHRRADVLQEVVRTGRRVSRLTSLDELLPDAARLVQEVFGFERVAIFLCDSEAPRVSLRATAGTFTGEPPLLFSVSREEGIVGWVATHGEPLRVDDVRAEPRYRVVPASEDAVSELAVPVRAGAEVLGVLDVQAVRAAAFDSSEEATLQILADQIGTAIQNARLFEQQHSLAVADERNRLAREIHDTLAQGLTAISLQLEVADAVLEARPEQAREKIIKALELTRASLEEARRSVMDLRAAPLQQRTLPSALEDLVGASGNEHGFRAEFAARGVTSRLPAAIEAGLYRIAQEALNNVAHHAGASVVRVTLELDHAAEGSERDSLLLSIEDDGDGFDSTTQGRRRGFRGFGLVGMHERARLLGGKLEVVSAPGSGTRVEVRVPIGPTEEATSARRSGRGGRSKTMNSAGTR